MTSIPSQADVERVRKIVLDALFEADNANAPPLRVIADKAAERIAAMPEAGWVLVPIEPTEEMIEAAHALDEDEVVAPIHDRMALLKAEGPALIYRAMLSASPAPPSSEQQP